MPPNWIHFWRKNVTNVDDSIIYMWTKAFLIVVWRNRKSEDWILLFYDACNSHIISRSIQTHFAVRIAVMELPDHISDLLQLLDVSIFGPMRHYVNEFMSESILRNRRDGLISTKLSSLVVLKSIRSGHNLVVTCNNVESGLVRTGIF